MAGQHESHEEYNADISLPLDGNNPLVRELIDTVLHEAERIARKSTQYTPEDLLEAAKFYAVGELPRLGIRKANAWNLAQKHERASAPEGLTIQKAATGYDGRPGFTGDYAIWLKERWNTEPELRAKYEELATQLSDTSGSSANNAEDGCRGWKDMKAVQRKSLADLQKQLAILERRQIDIICLACPSEKLHGVVFTTHGRAFEYYNLFCRQGGSYQDFEAACRGGKIIEHARAVTAESAGGSRPKDQLRVAVRRLMVESVNKADKSKLEPLKAVPRKADKFVEEMSRRKLHWKIPQGWNDREPLQIAEKLIDQHKESLVELKECLQNGTLFAECHP